MQMRERDPLSNIYMVFFIDFNGESRAPPYDLKQINEYSTDYSILQTPE